MDDILNTFTIPFKWLLIFHFWRNYWHAMFEMPVHVSLHHVTWKHYFSVRGITYELSYPFGPSFGWLNARQCMGCLGNALSDPKSLRRRIYSHDATLIFPWNASKFKEFKFRFLVCFQDGYVRFPNAHFQYDFALKLSHCQNQLKTEKEPKLKTIILGHFKEKS